MEHRFCRTCEKVALILVFILFIASGSAMGAGFALIEQSVSGLGNAYAGGAASAEDATTVFYNPAGLTHLTGSQVIAGTHVIMPSAKFNNNGSVSATGAPLTGDNGGDGGVTGIVPNLYYSKQLTNNVSFGLGINSPFGLATEYNDTWVGRYHAINSDMLTVNFNPSLAYKVNDNLSIGAGIDIQYVKVELSNAVDFGLIGYSLHVPGMIPQKNDGYVNLKGDSVGFGFNLGLLYEFSKNTRFGTAYRSRIKQTLKGDADYSNVPSALSSAFKDTQIAADVTLPDSLSVSLFHHINSQWAVMGDVTWTNWSVYDEMRIRFSSGQADAVTTSKWDDNMRYSAGLSYAPNKCTYRLGAAYDKTPISSAEYRTPRIPDGDRIWLAAGLGYKYSDRLNMDIGYVHIFVDDPEINKTATGEDASRGALKGTYDAHVNIVSAQVKWTF